MDAHPLRCRCGHLQGSVTLARSSQRVVCYCHDCRAFARYLGGDDVLDKQGGTEIVASLPSKLRLHAGDDALACLSLSPRGLLRWYAQCCRTPIGNTTRNPQIAYVGLVHTCLEQAGPPLADSFGPLRMAAYTASATGPIPVPKTPWLAATASLFGIGTALLGARLGGGWRNNPLFEPGSTTPVRAVHMLTPDERTRAYASG